MRTLLAVVAIIALAACEAPNGPDQCMRQQKFDACMKALPAGPVSPHYNDWSEVVEACGTEAYRQSLRRTDQIKPECRV